MTNEEIVERIQAGETEYIEQLWQQVERFVMKEANRVAENIKRAGKGTAVCDADDLYQSGYFAMLKAIDHWRPDMEGSFISYFAMCLKTAMAEASFHRTAKQMKDPTVFARSLDAPLTEDGDMTLGDTLVDPRDPLEAIENELYNASAKRAIESLFTLLTENERKVIEGHYLKGKHYVQIAEDMGLSKQRVNQLKDMAFRKMRTKMLTVPEAQFFREYVEDRTNYSLHYGVSTFTRTYTSEVEALVFARDKLEREALMLMPSEHLPEQTKTLLEFYQAQICALNRFDAYKKRRKARI